MSTKKGAIISSFLILVIILGGLLTGYLQIKNEELRLVFLLMGVIIGLIGIIILFSQLLGKKRKLHWRLGQIEKLLARESLETLKGKYREIYNLYLKIKEKDKQHFYERIKQLRERLEEQLKAEKRLQQLLGISATGTLEERKKRYEEITTLYQQLPLLVQEKHSGPLLQLKEELEKGV